MQCPTKDKGTYNDLQNTRTDNTMTNGRGHETQKTKDWGMCSRMESSSCSTFCFLSYNRSKTPTNKQKTAGELMCCGKVRGSCPTSGTNRVTVKRLEHHLIRKSCWTPVYENNTININKHELSSKLMGVNTNQTSNCTLYSLRN